MTKRVFPAKLASNGTAPTLTLLSSSNEEIRYKTKKCNQTLSLNEFINQN